MLLEAAERLEKPFQKIIYAIEELFSKLSSEKEFILEHQDTCQDIPREFVLPGLPLLSNILISGSSGFGANSHWAEKLGNNLAMYHRKSNYLLTN